MDRIQAVWSMEWMISRLRLTHCCILLSSPGAFHHMPSHKAKTELIREQQRWYLKHWSKCFQVWLQQSVDVFTHARPTLSSGSEAKQKNSMPDKRLKTICCPRHLDILYIQKKLFALLYTVHRSSKQTTRANMRLITPFQVLFFVFVFFKAPSPNLYQDICI